MISRIRVNGFKSLQDFDLTFNPGLNILVGPNGAGKTNIVSFFEFLACLMDTDASDATSKIGGAGSIFRRVGSHFERTIEASIIGCVKIPTKSPFTSRDESPQMEYCSYIYNFSTVIPQVGHDNAQALIPRGLPLVFG